MIKTLKLKPFLSLTAISAAGILVGFALFSGTQNANNQIGINLHDFEQGTKIDYRIIADGDIIEQNTKNIAHDGILSLPLPQNIAKSEKNERIKYQLDVTPPPAPEEKTAAQTLNLLLDLDKTRGDVSISAKGLKEFSGMKLKNGKNEKNLNADWAGLLSSGSLKGVFGGDQTGLVNSDMIQLAFQNSGVAGDLSALGNGKVDVFFSFFGDDTGSNVDAVQEHYSSGLREMTFRLSSMMTMQTLMVGTFFDARIQIATQRKLQELQARAHKDYHPSEQMCRIGTFVRSVAHTESKSEVDKKVLNKMMMNQYLGVENSAAAGSTNVDTPAKLAAFVARYCDPKDAGGALENICENADQGDAEVIQRKNKDIDYARTFEMPLTLDIDFADGTGTEDEEDIIALSKNLYFPKAFHFADARTISDRLAPHYDSRSFAAKMSVAHASFVNIVGMKASAPQGQPTTATATSPPTAVPPLPGAASPPRNPAPTVLDEDSGWAYMKAMMREFGITDTDEIDQILGERPSYYAQMEVLTKKMVQHPDFYTNLYDKPTNVARIGASLDAIAVMHQRDRFESMLRREMISAVLLEEALRPAVDQVNAEIEESIGKSE